MTDVSRAALLAVVRDDPFDPRPPRFVRVEPGETLSGFVDRLGFDPILRAHAVAVIDGEEVPVDAWLETRVRDGQHLAIMIAPQGGEDGSKILTTVLTIAVMVAAFWVAGGAFAGALGSAFAAGSTGAYIAAAAVSVMGNLAISALVKPPSIAAQAAIKPVYVIDGASNQFLPFEPITFSVGRRRVFPRLAARGFQELVGDDFYYRLVVEWGPIGVAISDLKFGDTPLSAIDGVEQQHRLVASDPHPTLYPAQVFQEGVGAALSDMSDWEMRRTIADATQATVILAFPTGLGHTNSKGKPEQWDAQVEIRYRSVTGDPGSEVLGSWQSPPGNGMVSPRGLTTPGPGRYGFSENKRSQPFYRAVTFNFPAAGLYEVEVRRSSPDADPETQRVFDDIQWGLFESRRPGQPIARDDVAYSVFRIKGTDETSGRIETINAILDRLIPRFDTGFIATGDLSEAGPASLTSVGLSRSMWEQILWAYRNGFDGRRPLTDAEIDWPSFAIAERDRLANGWNFDHVLDGNVTIEQAVETMAFAGCGRAAFIGNKLTAIVDAPQLAPVAVISDRKARNVRAIKRFTRPPDGFRITFDDASDGYRTREIRVYVNGHTAATATRFEQIQIPGVVDWNNVHRLVQRNYRNSRLQTRNLMAEIPDKDADPSMRLGAWVGIQTKVVEVGRASGYVRSVETNGLGQVTAAILDQPVRQTPGDELVLQWSRQTAPGVREEISNALPVSSPATEEISERIEFEAPLSGGDAPQENDMFFFGVAGSVRLDGLIDDIEAVDHDWLRLTLVDYAPARFEETGFTIPDYAPAFERPPFIRPPELELVSVIASPEAVTIHYRPKPGERGQIARFIAARAIAPDPGDATAAIGAWDALPDLPASARQLVAPGGQAGDVFVYRIAAVDPLGNIGPYLMVGAVEAIETLPAPTGVTANGITEEGVGGSIRPALIVRADPSEDVQLTELVAELRRVTLDLSDDRVPEEDQPPFEAGGSASPVAGRMAIRGLPAGARLDVEVYYRGANQALSPRVRVSDVILPAVDIAGLAAGVQPGSALEDFILAQAGTSIDEFAREQAAAALTAANEAFEEAETVRTEFEAADEALGTAIAARATIAALNTVESDAEAARTLLGTQITAAYTDAIDDAVGGLQTQINARATITALNTAVTNATSALAEGLDDVRAEFAAADDDLQTAINSKASVTELTTAITTEQSARASAISALAAAYEAADAALQTQINSRATLTQLATVETNANSAISALSTTFNAAIDGVEAQVDILQGVLAAPSGSEAIIAFRANTSSGIASLQVISTTGTLAPGTRIVLDADFVSINGRVLISGSVLPSGLAPSNRELVNPDSDFYDMAFHGTPITNSSVENRPGAGRVRRLQYSGTFDVSGAFFPIEQGATYRVRLWLFIASISTGTVALNIHIPSTAWACPAPTNTTLYGLPAINLATTTIQKDALVSFEGQFTAASPDAFRLQERITALDFDGVIDYRWEIYRASDAALIVDGAVRAQHIDVATLDAVSANVGLLRTASSGARMELEANQLRSYYASGMLALRLGVW